MILLRLRASLEFSPVVLRACATFRILYLLTRIRIKMRIHQVTIGCHDVEGEIKGRLTTKDHKAGPRYFRVGYNMTKEEISASLPFRFIFHLPTSYFLPTILSLQPFFFSSLMRLVADPRRRLYQERTKLLLIEVAEHGFADNGIISELEGL